MILSKVFNVWWLESIKKKKLKNMIFFFNIFGCNEKDEKKY